jgi:DNA-directed RNA polymerase subunit M/transcription elongation factor TFIIS
MRCPNCDFEPMHQTDLHNREGDMEAVLYECPKCRTSERREY